MSERLFKFLLSELKTVRVSCPKCEAVVELTVEQMGYRLNSLMCPVCNADWPGFRGPANENTLSQLGKAIHAIQSQPGGGRVEFVLPDAADTP